MNIVELWRYPVKSLQGERLDAAQVTANGLQGDRSYGIVDVDTGYVLTGRREPRLLFASAAWRDGEVVITGPDGEVLGDDAALSAWLDRTVELRAAGAAGIYETQLDFEQEDTAEWFQWSGPEGTFHDSTRTQVSIVATGTIGEWDRRRFRINVIFDEARDAERVLLGSTVRAGAAELDVVKEIDRCVMVTRSQPNGIERDLDVLRTIVKQRAGNLGVGALVTRSGAVAVGDVLVAI